MPLQVLPLLFLLLLPSVTGCANKVVRNLDTLVAENVAALTRQEAASAELKAVAACIRDGGDFVSCGLTCEDVVAPALRIDHRAEAEAYRAIWLAGGVYPNADGSIPASSERQPDPGAPGPFDRDGAVSLFCSTED